jgi:PQQ-dependent dehydrogenase (methanol/ethanol family)
MKRYLAVTFAAAMAVAASAQKKDTGVSAENLERPAPEDWLMYSRTYDAQRYSPLEFVNRRNVPQLKTAWSKPLATGTLESIPIVHNGIMYLAQPGASVLALNAATGEQIWEYKREGAPASRTKTLAIYRDLVYYTAPDGFIVALDAATGKVRWETKTDGGMTSGPVVIEGKVLTGRTCNQSRKNCYISAHDALTGAEAWRFYTAAGDDDPGGASWGGSLEDKRFAATWGLPGNYDPALKLIYWGVANPTPNTRMERHGGKFDAIPFTAPADLYSNSTLALNPQTGKLVWYYQHLPGDDWDEDYTHERTLLRTRVNPDPKFVKWINPDIRRGEQRDVAVMVGEGGGMFMLDRRTGQFLWGSPFPFDAPNFLISNIDGKTGRVTINRDLVFTGPGQHHIICFWNTRSYWPTAYHPRQNALFVPWVDNCLDNTSASPAADGKPAAPAKRAGIQREGGKPEEFGGLAKINMETGEIQHIYKGRAPGNGAVLTTAGDLVFWGDLDGKFRAFDAASGKILWETTLGGPVDNSTISYAVNGKQYIAVLSGEGLLTGGLITEAGISPPRRHNEMYVFALPDQR